MVPSPSRASRCASIPCPDEAGSAAACDHGGATMKHVSFPGHLVMLGCGSIGQGVLALIMRHIDIAPDRITIVTADERGHDVADEYGIAFVKTPITRDNYEAVLRPMLGNGDFLLNLSVDVSSVALIGLCRGTGSLYLDTCIEPWEGGYTDPSLRSEEHTSELTS